LLPRRVSHDNPVDVRGDATPSRFADAVSIVLSDDAVDAVLALHVPRPIIGAVEAAQAVASAARDARKPVLGAWLGAIERPEAHDALEAGGVANFYTPENAVEAFSFLAAYRRRVPIHRRPTCSRRTTCGAGPAARSCCRTKRTRCSRHSASMRRRCTS
jgi:acetyltransferase